MNNNTFDIEIMRSTVEILAHQTFPKIKKPTHLGIDDLVQEGLMVCWEWVHRWYKPNSGASIKTFATNGVKFHFKDLITKSWKSVDTIVCSEEEDSDTPFINTLPSKSISEILYVMNSLMSFSEKEREYITLILNPGADITRRLVNHPRQLRQMVRTRLKINIEMENALRSQIQHKLEQMNKE